MPLGPEQIEKTRGFFRTNGVVPDCPYCGTGGWEAGEIISCAVADDQGAAGSEGASVAMVQFVCDNCGHVALFDASRIGLV